MTSKMLRVAHALTRRCASWALGDAANVRSLSLVIATNVSELLHEQNQQLYDGTATRARRHSSPNDVITVGAHCEMHTSANAHSTATTHHGMLNARRLRKRESSDSFSIGSEVDSCYHIHRRQQRCFSLDGPT